MRWLGVHLACWLLKMPLNIQQRTKLTGAILKANNALPLNEVITFSNDGKNTLIVNGEPLEYERAVNLRESARGALENIARALVLEQVASIAGKRGISEGDTPEKLYFYRAAIWFGEMEQTYLRMLAGK